MPTLSIEVLCVGAHRLRNLPEPKAYALAVSDPPLSDRGPSPIWQAHMARQGGALVHLFDQSCVGQRQRWAYDFLDETDWRRFRFKRPARKSVRDLLQHLLEQSEDGLIWFYSDAQWSHAPKVFATTYSLDRFFQYHDRDAIRMNSAISIAR